MRERLITAACQLTGALTGRLASRQDTVPPPNPRFVIVRRCCLGDVLESTAVLDAVRRSYPMATIDYATSAYSAPALAGNPDVSAVFEPSVAGLRRGGYDVAITLERSPRTGLLAWQAGIPIRVGPNNLSRGFAHNLRVACPPDRSEAQVNLDCAEALGIPTAGARLKFCPGRMAQAAAADLLRDGGPWVAIAPGGGINPGMRLTSKRWPAERFRQTSAALLERHGLRTVLIGTGDDPSIIGIDSVDLVGRTTLAVTAAVIQRSQLFIGNDSAPLHLAAAVGTRYVGIFGPSDPLRHRPLGEGEIIAAPIPRSAYSNGFADVDCIGLVAVEAVLAACERLLADG